MSSILISIIVFLIVCIIQLCVLRVFRTFQVHPFVSFITHGVGFLVVLVFVIQQSELPLATLLVYILLTFLQITFSFVPLLGQRSPSSIIMSQLQMKPQTESEMASGFDEKQMIYKRVEDLVKVGLLYKKGDTYIISPIGSYVARLISTVCVLMGLSTRG